MAHNFLDLLFQTGYMEMAAVGTTAVVGALGTKYLYRTYKLAQTKEKIRRRQLKSRETIHHVQRLVDSKKVKTDIVHLPFSELQKRLQAGDLKPSEVLLAFQAKALQAHAELNCVTEFIITAQERAATLDSVPPNERGPLHGIPISLKEAIGVAGSDCNTGCSYFIDDMYTEDSVIVQMLVALGAVPFCRTNLSQAQMSISCYNPIYGTTYNPHQKHRTSGGSSGGEGALIGAGGSILGVGCDMGGSNRIPAHLCGIVGVKPTAKRISGHGCFSYGQHITTIAEMYGPMGRDVDAVLAFMRAMLSPKVCTFDPLLAPVLWREELYASKKPMRIGYYVSDGCVEPVPAVCRAVELAKQTLANLGHTIVEFSPFDVEYAFEKLFLGVVLGDDGKMAKDILVNDLQDPSVQELITLYNKPVWFRKLLSKLCFFLHPIEKALVRAQAPRSICDWWNKNEDVEKYTRQFIAQWKKLQLDALICPAFPCAAWPADQEGSCIVGVTYTTVYNIMGFPCGVVPATQVTQQDVVNMKSYPARNSAEKHIQEISKGSEGLPIGVQCVALPYMDEVLIKLMKELETGLNK
ncbi:fatty-acid amide hydrolase 1-like [Physella acuta]|uniref:fatty-acid amide hydrolase 1-like n=1 Tax=Physella acuta TaxID=109671 RepID=UPI0027DD31AF|nr:fatty-acid amide hydrolase 1-like [Physella acuta]